MKDSNRVETLLNGCFVTDEFHSVRYYYLWYKARTSIFQLYFDDSDEDKALVKEALSLFKEVFDGYKYYGGKTLYEFLPDAIAANVYFSHPETKTVMANVQDDTGKSSIKTPGKTYWGLSMR